MTWALAGKRPNRSETTLNLLNRAQNKLKSCWLVFEWAKSYVVAAGSPKLCGRINVAGCFGAEGDEGRCRCRRELFVAVVRERGSEPPFVSGSPPLAGSAVVYRYRRTSYVLPEQMSCGSRASEERRKVEEDCGAGGLFLRHGEKEKNQCRERQ